MHWIPCSVIEFSVFQAAWNNGSLLNEVYFMQHDWMHWIPAAWMNAVNFLQRGPKHPHWMQWIPCSVIECRRLHALWHNESRLYSVRLTQWGPMHPIECSGLYAAWPKSRLKAVDSMQHDWIQWIICIMAQSIAIECSGFHAASFNAEHSIHCGAMDLVCM